MTRSRRRGIVFASALFTVGALVNGVLAVPASARRPRCFGVRATIVGTSGADIMNGTRRSDVIVGLGGGTPSAVAAAATSSALGRGTTRCSADRASI
jgi:hypothetical protein